MISAVEPGGPAEKAKVQVGDRILSVWERKVSPRAQVKAGLTRMPGRKAWLDVERAGEEHVERASPPSPHGLQVGRPPSAEPTGDLILPVAGVTKMCPPVEPRLEGITVSGPVFAAETKALARIAVTFANLARAFH